MKSVFAQLFHTVLSPALDFRTCWMNVFHTLDDPDNLLRGQDPYGRMHRNARQTHRAISDVRLNDFKTGSHL